MGRNESPGMVLGDGDLAWVPRRGPALWPAPLVLGGIAGGPPGAGPGPSVCPLLRWQEPMFEPLRLQRCRSWC